MNATHRPLGEHVSRLAFDRLIAGELAPEQAEQLELHVRACARCASLLAEQRAEHVVFPSTLPSAVAARVRRRESASSRRSRAAVPLLAAAGVLLGVSAWLLRPAAAPEDSVRSKGALHTTFYVLHDGEVRPGADGERVQPGDRLEFAYSIERDAYLAIVSVDAARKVTAYYADGERAASIVAARRKLLDRSTLLDDTLGPELVYALLCAEPIALAEVLIALERAPERAPVVPGCAVERHSLLKVPR